MNWTYNDMFLTFSMYWLWKHWKVAVSNRKYTITLDELHFTSDLSDSNQPGTFKLTNHSWKFNAPSFLLTFPVQSGCCNEKSPVCGLSCFLLTVGGGGTGRESCKCSSILPRRFLQDSSLDFSLQNQVGRSKQTANDNNKAVLRTRTRFLLCAFVFGPSHVRFLYNTALLIASLLVLV